MASDTRNRILSVAARLFEAQGFEGTAVAAILREADVNSGSLYHFFPSKEALLVAVLEKYVEVLEPALLGAADRAADDPIEKVFALLELYRGRLLVSEYSRGCPAGELALEVGGRLPEARGLLDSYFESWTNRVEEWLVAAGDRLPHEADRHALAAHVLAILQGAIMQARIAASIEPFDDSVSQLRLLLRLLGSGAAASGASRPAGRRPPPATRVRAAEPMADGAAAPAGSASRAAGSTATEAIEGDDEWWRAW
ncbi:MAG: TetR/AcrR family transcriptional regulator [Gemmatimonadetes bacterium]|nr:TetR/AcrR family transcriptional regulator [Gemmatimonadota bacterium]